MGEAEEVASQDFRQVVADASEGVEVAVGSQATFRSVSND